MAEEEAPRDGAGAAFGVGDRVEVRQVTEGLQNSWYRGELVEVVDDESVMVQYDDFFDETDETQHEVESVRRDRLRAEVHATVDRTEDLSMRLLLTCPVFDLLEQPPPPPSNWMHRVLVGACLEIRIEEGWWPVRLLQKRVGGKDMHKVESRDYEKVHMVSSKRLRPAP